MRIGGGVGAGSGVKRLTGVAEASAARGWMSVGRLAGAFVLAPSVVSSSSASMFFATWIRFAGVGGSTSGAASSSEANVGADARGERARRGGGVGGGSAAVRRIVLALSSTSSLPLANRFSVRAQSALSNGRFCVVASSSSIESGANLGNATCDGVGIESIALGGGVITRRRGFRLRSSEDEGGDDDSLGSARLALHQNSRRLTAPT